MKWPESLSTCSDCSIRQTGSKPMDNTQQRRAFKQRVKHWAVKLDIKVKWLGIRPMRNKWASCSTNGNLNFNDELVAMDEEIWDYVIVHELLHFYVPNHGKLWKSLMTAHLGNYRTAEQRLLRHGAVSSTGRS